MNEKIIKEDLKEVKARARYTAKYWINHNMYAVYQPSNNRVENDDTINVLRLFYRRLEQDWEHNADPFFLYMFKYTTKMMIEIINAHSDRISRVDLSPSKNRSSGI